MKIWRLVSGIISITLSLVMLFQAFVLGFADMLSDFQNVFGNVGVMYTNIAFWTFISGIVSTVLWKNTSKPADVVLFALYGIVAINSIITSIISPIAHYWFIWALGCSVVAAFSLYNQVNEGSNKRLSEFRQEAREALTGLWGSSAIMTFVYIVLVSAAGVAISQAVPYAGNVISTLALVPMTMAFAVAFLRLFRRDPQELGCLFQEFNSRVYQTMILSTVYTWLWTLLLIIPGIVKSYSYAMTPYILEDRPDLSGDKAIEESMRMMSGHKWELFWLHLTFIGWGLLCILTLGIGIFWLIPYMNTAQAAFYENLKSQEA